MKIEIPPTDKLIECPFCGDKDVEICVNGGWNDYETVCHDCGVRIVFPTMASKAKWESPSKERTIKLFNNRVPTPELFGKQSVVLFFDSEKEREEFVEACKKHKNLREKQV